MRTEQEVLQLNNPDESYYYCWYNKDANVKLHEDIIVNSKDVQHAYLFARDIPGADIQRLQEIVINSYNSYNAYEAYYFALRVENSNKEELFKTILKIGDKYWIDKFIRYIPISQELKELVIFI